MTTNIKIFNKIQTKYTKKAFTLTHWDLSKDSKFWHLKSINVIYHANTIKDKNPYDHLNKQQKKKHTHTKPPKSNHKPKYEFKI